MNDWNSLSLEGGAGAYTGVKAFDIGDVGVWMLIPLEGAPGRPPASLSSPFGGGLRQGPR